MVEQSAAVALEIADYAYVMENGRIVLDGTASGCATCRHPGILSRQARERRARSYREVKQYRRQAEMVWLSSRSRASACGSAALPCSTASRS